MYTILTKTIFENSSTPIYETSPMTYTEAKAVFDERLEKLMATTGDATLDVRPMARHSFSFKAVRNNVVMVEITWMEEV